MVWHGGRLGSSRASEASEGISRKMNRTRSIQAMIDGLAVAGRPRETVEK